jgi:hypothetical protein
MAVKAWNVVCWVVTPRTNVAYVPVESTASEDYKTIRRHNPEDHNPHFHVYE